MFNFKLFTNEIFFILFFLSIIGFTGINAQVTYEYYYDYAGNRVMRQVINLNRNSKADSNIVIKSTQYSIYPNPVNELLTIEITNSSVGQFLYKISDINGKVLKQVSSNEKITKINFSDLPAGIYFLQLNTPEEKKEWKIIKD